MDTAWIQVFVLTLSECIAPAGKTVCQERVVEYQFADRTDCAAALQEILLLKDSSEQIIVNKDKSACVATLRQQQVFRTLDAASEELGDTVDWDALPEEQSEPDFIESSHAERLAAVPDCDAVAGVAPCKIGEIIIEGATVKKTELWKKQ